MTREIFLTGTPRTEPEPRVLSAGNLEVSWDNAALRCLRWNGVEIIRAVLFLVRTPGWGTPEGVLSNVEIDEQDDSFSISFHQHFGERGEGIGVDISCKGDASGHLSVDAIICADIPSKTFRTGLIVLQPLDGFAGMQVHVDHADGDPETHTISRQLSPGQPLFDIKAITHQPVPGMTVRTDFEGDIFEMEDHRQWSDASFKTYNRPINLPLPYTLDPETPVKQSVIITATGGGGAMPAPAIDIPASDGQTLPLYALPLDCPKSAGSALDHIDVIKALKPARLLVRHDGARDSGADLSPLARLAADTGATIEMQAILCAESDEAASDELKELAQACAAADLKVARIAALPKVDEASFQPGQERPAHASDPAIAKALLKHFPDAVHIGGTPAFFTEFNRKRPDPKLWGGLTFATTPIVHAAEDRSVMETLQALPHILTTATELAEGLPVAIGPTGIGMRLNPYGEAPIQNDPVAREGMAARDPRQRGLFAAAWAVGYLARIAPYNPERFAFGAPTGPFGLISTRQDYTRPFWDDQEEGVLYPLFHVARWIARSGGCALEAAGTDNETTHIVWRDEIGRYALIANLSATRKPMPDIPFSASGHVRLDAETLPSLMHEKAPALSPGSVDTLDAYAVIYCEEGPST
jgi:hypothetical protein